MYVADLTSNINAADKNTPWLKWKYEEALKKLNYIKKIYYLKIKKASLND